MKRLATILALMAMATLTATAQIGTWKAFLSYYEPQQIAKVGNRLYVRASNGLYSYNLDDQSITTYDKVRQLNDSRISLMAWNQQGKRLILVYDNCNIDLLDLNDNVVNISALYSKTMTQDKTVNNIYIHEQYAYLATAFGVVKLNMQRAEISESYILNYNITSTAVKGDSIYAQISQKWTEDNGTPVFPFKFEGVDDDIYQEYLDNWNKTHTITFIIAGALKDNLIDPHNWHMLNNAPTGIFTNDMTDWNENIALVRTLQPGGPKYNYFGFTRFKNNKLYTCPTMPGTSLVLKGTVQILDDNGEWTFLQDDMTGVPGTESSSWAFVNTFTVDTDPFDSNHLFVSSRTGLYEYYGDTLVCYYNKDNSILKPATSSNRYVTTYSAAYDKGGNLWLLQSHVAENSIIEITKDGEWISHPQSLLMKDGLSLATLRNIFFDSRGLMWFVNAHYELPSIYCYDTEKDEIISSIIKLVNQDGVSAREAYNPKCIAEDLDHNIWIGTSAGPYMIEASAVGGPLEYANQIKVPRNDGTNYADYLLSNVEITCMAIDGANRKWFGTASGVFLISADNMTQIANFTTKNSPLLSDKIESISINNETGEVFIGTDNGLCSYMSDATTASIEMVKDDVYAYPNPVVSGYDGLITIRGLSFDADVKILSTSGQLVAQGRSNGGTFTWNGRDRQGRRVASGVYMVAAATSDGKKGTVCKIAVIK